MCYIIVALVIIVSSSYTITSSSLRQAPWLSTYHLPHRSPRVRRLTPTDGLGTRPITTSHR